MFAVYAFEPNPDEPLKSLTVGERPEPEVGDGWVAVDVAAGSLNMHDLWTLRGVGIKPDQFPMILGCDGAGRLADGSEVVLYPVIGDPGLAGDETLDPKRSLLTEKYQGTFACPASSSWQDFGLGKVGHSGVGQAEVDVVRSVPGECFVRADGVVVDSVALGVHGQVEDVVDLFEEQLLVLQRPEPALSRSVLPWRPDAAADVPEFGVGGDERLEPERAERPAVVGDDRHQRLEVAVGVARGQLGQRPPGQPGSFG
jgi:hypothetical protein